MPLNELDLSAPAKCASVRPLEAMAKTRRYFLKSGMAAALVARVPAAPRAVGQIDAPDRLHSSFDPWVEVCRDGERRPIRVLP